MSSDVDGDGTVSAGESALNSYARTYATNPAVTVTALQEQGALPGFAAGSNLAGASVSHAVSSFKTASIAMAPGGTSLTINIDGRDFTLPRQGAPLVTSLYQGGPDVTFYSFGVANTQTAGDGAILINQKYSSLAVFLKGYAPGDQNNGPSVGGYTLVATGAETPENQLPAQLVTYKGEWGLALASTGSGSGGKFDASADFNTKVLTYDVKVGGGASAGSGTGTIRGNQFSGAFDNTMSVNGAGWTGSGEFAGAFYGPNADEITGVISGAATSDQGGEDSMAGYFIGSKAQ